jgi:hypothetical protein
MTNENAQAAVPPGIAGSCNEERFLMREINQRLEGSYGGSNLRRILSPVVLGILAISFAVPTYA